MIQHLPGLQDIENLSATTADNWLEQSKQGIRKELNGIAHLIGLQQ